MDPFIGEIIMFGGNFAPRGWAFCNGQLLDINSHSALFSILGTTYGGDGRTTFGLPELRGRVAMHAGNGPGLTPRPLGQKSGQESVTLTQNQIPAHHHFIDNSQYNLNLGDIANAARGNGNMLAVRTTNTDAPGGTAGDQIYTTTPSSNKLAAGSVSGPANTLNTGGNQQHNNIQPYQVVNYIIALEGTYPSRS